MPSPLVAVMLLLLGCGRSALEAAKDLPSPDVEVRARAAAEIEDEAEDKALVREVVDALLLAAARETDDKTQARLMLALGYSGDRRAKEVLDAYARTDDEARRKVAAAALQAWSIKTGRFPAGHRFPARDWPYGTEAYPSSSAAIAK